jgi:hypothetical protein
MHSQRANDAGTAQICVSSFFSFSFFLQYSPIYLLRTKEYTNLLRKTSPTKSHVFPTLSCQRCAQGWSSLIAPTVLCGLHIKDFLVKQEVCARSF